MTGAAGREDPVRAFLEGAVARRAVPSASWCVEASGRTVTEGTVGFRALEPRPEPAGEDTPYDLASLTKPLATALLAVLLEEEGTLDLERPALDLLPELRGSAYEGVTLLDLAAHRARLPSWRPLYLAASDLPGYLARIADEPPGCGPGETLYSDLGYILLGAAVERAGGAGLEVLFEDRVARPLALGRTGFAARGRRLAAAAATERGNAYERSVAGDAGAGFPWREGVICGEVHDANAWWLGGVAGHAGLFSTAREVARIAREILTPTVLPLGPRARSRLLGPAPDSATRTCGFARAAEYPSLAGSLPPDAVGHMGFTGTSVWLDPARARLFVLLTNRVHPVVEGDAIHEIRREFHALSLEACEGAPSGNVT